MLKIRLMRIGAKKRPFYRVVVIDERSKRSGEYLELLGTYNPLTSPHEINLKQDRIDHWVKQGAQLSDGFLRMTGKAPQRPARKPKKSHAAEAPRDEQPKTDEQPAREAANEEAKSSEPEATETTAEQPQTEIDSSPAVQNDKTKAEEEQKDEGSA